MYDSKLIKHLGMLVKSDDEDTLSLYLDLAKETVLNRLYPFGYTEETEVPFKYQSLLVRIATFLYDKEGAEGEVQHSEGGITRQYGASDIPAGLLSEIVPYCGSFVKESDES